MARKRTTKKVTKNLGGRPKGTGKSLKLHELEGTLRGYHKPKPKPLKSKPKLDRLPTKRESQKWVRNESDAKALAAGYRFSERLAEFTVYWIAEYLCFSEGIWAGKPFDLADWQRDEVVYPAFGWIHKFTEPPFDGLIARRIHKI